MVEPKIYRKRIIPDEIVDISGDKLLYIDDEIIITKWKPIRPRNDFSGGVSYTFLKKGYKISRFYGENEEILYYYCDIINIDYNDKTNAYIIKDLLADVKVYPDGKYEILDLDEVVDTFRDELISKDEVLVILSVLNKLLNDIKKGNFPPEICMDKKYW